MDQNLPALVEQAASRLASAKTYAEVLEARVEADAVYELAKRSSRLARKLEAHNQLADSAHKLQGDALLILKEAANRLANEYDAAQERKEVIGRDGGRPKTVPEQNGFFESSAKDLNLSRKEIHEARRIRDAERLEPGLIGKTIDALVKAGHEPTKARMREAIDDILRAPPKKKRPHLSTVKEDRWEHLSKTDPCFFARMETVGSCNRLMDCAKNHPPEQVVEALLNDDTTEWQLKLIRGSLKYLAAIVEAIDGHEVHQSGGKQLDTPKRRSPREKGSSNS